MPDPLQICYSAVICVAGRILNLNDLSEGGRERGERERGKIQRNF